ncbi:MAG TPA: SAM-dependent methyltransferase, partial [Patescibacteria group bacterium]|nr:SAM-dependent methyltransferase [Patescibacteria group bacterium]
MTNIKKIISQYITPSVRLRVRSTYQSLLYSGNAVFCPCCGESFRKFLPNDKRQNARCPKCHALERHRLLWLYLQRCTNFFSHS